MTDRLQTTLHIPEGINFECSGCGNCCFSLPVPLTDLDVEKIKLLAGPEAERSAALFKRIAPSHSIGAIYTHTLEKKEDGRCGFLTDSNQCRLHLEHGAAAKPTMCQLFPYTFTPCPSGIYASLSFASTAVLRNSGAPLTDQGDLLASRLRLLQSLMPDYKPDWSNIQLVDGVPLDWQRYLALEEEMLALLNPLKPSSLTTIELCQRLSEICVRALPAATDLERNLTDARPKVVDQILLRALADFYFPQNVFATTASSTDLPAAEIARQLVNPPNKVLIECLGEATSVGWLLGNQLGALVEQSDELLRRFLYCRIFAKLYFGPGFNGLSVIAGLHHLLFTVCLVRIMLKVRSLPGQRPVRTDQESFAEAQELVRMLERRLTVARFSRQSIAMLEVLLASQSRIERILSISA